MFAPDVQHLSRLRRSLLAGLILLILPHFDSWLPDWPTHSETGTTQTSESTADLRESPSESRRDFHEIRYQMLCAAWGKAFSRYPTIRQSSQQVQPLVNDVCELAREHGVPVSRALAFILVESRGDRRALSTSGARGLMQILPDTGRVIAQRRGEKVADMASALYDRRLNVDYGIWYYRSLLELFNQNERAATAAYNWGPETIRLRLAEGGEIPRIYADKIEQAEAWLKRRFKHEYNNLWSEDQLRDLGIAHSRSA